MVKWSMDLLIGIQDIDVSHKQLVELLNQAYEDFLVGINVEEDFIDKLFNCMANCFDCEETWMIKTSYPSFSVHKHEHEIFTQRFLEIYDHYEQDANTSIEILMFLNNWINHHIRETDMKFGLFVDGKKLSMRSS